VCELSLFSYILYAQKCLLRNCEPVCACSEALAQVAVVNSVLLMRKRQWRIQGGDVRPPPPLELLCINKHFICCVKLLIDTFVYRENDYNYCHLMSYFEAKMH